MTTPTIQVGTRFPEATLRTLSAEGPKTVSTGEFFKGRKIVVLGVPGAFTGTCSKTHLPSFLEHAAAIRAKGVAEIACVAVNDMFVLDAWSKSSGAAGKVTMLSDGNGELAEKLGLVLDASGHGMGKRFQRFSMVVDNGTVKALKVEPKAGVCEITNAPSILAML